MSSKLLIILGIIVVIAIAGAFVFLRDSSLEQENENPASQNAVLQEYNENTLEQFHGKPLIVNTWATWCPFCIDELPDFVEIQKEFGDTITIIAVNRQESSSQAQRFINDLNVADDLIYFLDADDSFYKEINGFSMPETIFVDRDGVIQDHKRGPMNADEIRQRLQSIL